jgi:signal peptidase I
MEDVLIRGDHLVVCKFFGGLRIFRLNEKGEDVFRIFNIMKLRHNDVLVFNFPYPHSLNKIDMDMTNYYIKRCVGLPGDTLQITNGIYRVNGINYFLGDIDSQKRLSLQRKNDFDEIIYNTFPQDSFIKWNIKDFGPIYIPRRGDKLLMNRTNYCLYKTLIEWEQKTTANYINSVFLNKEEFYVFKRNYYFVAGDRPDSSFDSRYWGLLPEDHIAGKALFIWKSVNMETNKLRWNRFLNKMP